MSRELRVTLVIMAVVLIVCSPAILAEPAAAPSHYNYLAAVFHIVVTTPTVTPCRDDPDSCAADATDAAVDAKTATADARTATARATLGTRTPTPTRTPVPPIGTKVLPSPTTPPAASAD